MKNFVLISPNFPRTYFRFAQALKKDGFRVLGVGDEPYDSLAPELKESLTEYYKVNNLDNFDEEKRAVGYFQDRYGHIDYLESNNEYWLRKDSILRDIFNIDTGLREHELDHYQKKSEMKQSFEKAGVKVAPYILVGDHNELVNFAKKHGYPLFIKSDIGVGAAISYKIKNLEDLEAFYAEKDANISYICETYVTGDIVTFDGVADKDSNVVFYSSMVCPPSISDVAKAGLDMFYYVNKKPDPNLVKAGHAAVKAFRIRKRFFHFEFFKVTMEREGFFQIGDIVGLEVNIRPPGGYTPDMINFGNSLNCYQIYADVMAEIEPEKANGDKYYLATASRRWGKNYFYTDEDIFRTFQKELCNTGIYPDVLADCMGNKFYMAKFSNKKDMEVFHAYVNKLVEPSSGSKKKSSMFNKDGNSYENICDTHIDGA